MPDASAKFAAARAKITDLEAQLALEQRHLGYWRADYEELQAVNTTLREKMADLEQEVAHLAAARQANRRLFDAVETQRAEIRQLTEDRERSAKAQAEITAPPAQQAALAAGGGEEGPQDGRSGALEAAVARAYADALRKSLRNMAVATELHGLPPDGEALLYAINHAIDKANAHSIEAGVVFLSAQEKAKMEDEAPAHAAEDMVAGRHVYHEARRLAR
jgi:hypothetical protein